MNALPHPALPAFHSAGGRARTAQVQAYLEGLHRVYLRYRPLPPVTLFVLSEKDWRERTRVPYGLPFQRTSRLRLYLFIPLVYPDHLLHRLRQALLPVAEGGLPGPLAEFLDLTLGHEYAHAVQVAWRLRSGRRWLDEFLANYLFLFALQRAYPDRYPLYLAWARLLARLKPQNPRLSAYDRLRTGLVDALHFQGVFTLKADALVQKGEEALIVLLQAPSPKEAYRSLLKTLPDLTDLRLEGPGPSPPGT
ncbi:MAG: hypothetical protein C4301_05465 [Thermus sp.]|uniref:hypothetical protein n=1 Tax=Thermus sp. TaxID=275 RepID=UPI00332552B5